MSMRAKPQELKRASMKRKEWHTPQQRPDYAKDAPEISVTVLMYDPEDDMHGLGWFNFDLDKWNAFDDFDFSRPFVWCYLPKPQSK
jgi:hypothetical protein